MIADTFGENGDPIERVDGYAQMVVQLELVLAHLTGGESASIVQKCGRNSLEAWRGSRKRFDPLIGVGICCARSWHHSKSRCRILVQPCKRGKRGCSIQQEEGHK